MTGNQAIEKASHIIAPVLPRLTQDEALRLHKDVADALLESWYDGKVKGIDSVTLDESNHKGESNE